MFCNENNALKLPCLFADYGMYRAFWM